MKYLDAKRRLIFMMATVKYIRLLFKNEITITDDEIKLIVAKSLPLIFKDYTIKVEDVNEIVEGIKSCVLRINNSLNISKISQEATIETIRRDIIHIDENIFVDNIAKLITSLSNKLVIDENLINLSDSNKLTTSQIKPLKNGELPIILKDKLVLIIQKSIPFIFDNENIKVEDKNIILDNISSIILQPKDEKIESKYEMVMETIIRNSLYINEKISVKDELVDLINSIANSFYINSFITVNDYNRLRSSISNKLKVDSKITVDNAFELVALYSDLVLVNDLVLSGNDFNLQTPPSNKLLINESNKITNDVVLTLGNFISLPFEINTKLFINNKVFLDISDATNVIINSLLNINYTNIIRVDESRNLIDDIKKLNINDCLQILRYRYSLLKDWELTEIDDILNLDMSEFIYVLK